MTEYPLAKLVWLDIIRPEDTWMWHEEAEKLEPARITTVGWIIFSNESHVIVASSLGDDKQLGDINCIPLCVIESMEHFDTKI
tara:strand:+ start:605 stop:853 length:249 start_codon:yes stop_codon:yes gene_type:complete